MLWMCSVSLLIYRSWRGREQEGKGRQSGVKGTGGGRAGKRGTGIGRFWPPCSPHKKADPNLSWRQVALPKTLRLEYNDQMTEWLWMNENFTIVQRHLAFSEKKKIRWDIWLLFSFEIIKEANTRLYDEIYISFGLPQDCANSIAKQCLSISDIKQLSNRLFACSVFHKLHPCRPVSKPQIWI